MRRRLSQAQADRRRPGSPGRARGGAGAAGAAADLGRDADLRDRAALPARGDRLGPPPELPRLGAAASPTTARAAPSCGALLDRCAPRTTRIRSPTSSATRGSRRRPTPRWRARAASSSPSSTTTTCSPSDALLRVAQALGVRPRARRRLLRLRQADRARHPRRPVLQARLVADLRARGDVHRASAGRPPLARRARSAASTRPSTRSRTSSSCSGSASAPSASTTSRGSSTTGARSPAASPPAPSRSRACRSCRRRAVSEHLRADRRRRAGRPAPAIPHRAAARRRSERTASPAEPARAASIVPGAGDPRSLERLLGVAARGPLPGAWGGDRGRRRGRRGADDAAQRVERRRPAGDGSSAARGPPTCGAAAARAASGCVLLRRGRGRRARLARAVCCLHASLPGVVAAGPLLARPDGRTEAAGFAVGLDHPALPMLAGLDADADGYYGSLACARDVSAISADFMLRRRAAFERGRRLRARTSPPGTRTSTSASGCANARRRGRLRAAPAGRRPRDPGRAARVARHRRPGPVRRPLVRAARRAATRSSTPTSLRDAAPRSWSADGHAIPGASARPEPMRLVIVYFGPLNINSAIQAFHFANDLTERRLARDPRAGIGDPSADPRGRRAELRVRHPPRPAGGARALPARREPTVVFAWTPRENVRVATEELRPPPRRPVRRPPRGQRVAPATAPRSAGPVERGRAASRSPSRIGSARRR